MNHKTALRREIWVACTVLLATIVRGFVYDNPITIISRNRLQKQFSPSSRDLQLDMNPTIEHNSGSTVLRYKNLSQEEEQDLVTSEDLRTSWINQWFEDHLPHFAWNDKPPPRGLTRKKRIHDRLVEVRINKEILFLKQFMTSDQHLPSNYCIDGQRHARFCHNSHFGAKRRNARRH